MTTNQSQPRQSKGTPVGGQFAGKCNPEPEFELAEHPARHQMSIAGRTYMLTTGSYGDGRRTYDLVGGEGGGWRIDYDPKSKTAKAEGRQPLHPTPEWNDKGEANILDVVPYLEPEAETVTVRGKEYKLASPESKPSPDAMRDRLVQLSEEKAKIEDEQMRVSRAFIAEAVLAEYPSATAYTLTTTYSDAGAYPGPGNVLGANSQVLADFTGGDGVSDVEVAMEGWGWAAWPDCAGDPDETLVVPIPH